MSELNKEALTAVQQLNKDGLIAGQEVDFETLSRINGNRIAKAKADKIAAIETEKARIIAEKDQLEAKEKQEKQDKQLEEQKLIEQKAKAEAIKNESNDKPAEIRESGKHPVSDVEKTTKQKKTSSQPSSSPV